ncbi:MAG: type II toxin-antitoxin system VapC family toxin [Chloroflexi bacterium]|nr:type II toxin-antitoxin system VapC family toxin [Chloroflexota bacterium]
MRTAVDTSVLIDLLAGEEAASVAAGQVLSSALASGPLVICPVVYAELAAAFSQQEELLRFLQDFGVQLESFSAQALLQAAAAWKSYTRRRGQKVQCPRCGHSFEIQCPACQSRVAWRQHIISDFLVGGHAAAQAGLLITRDAGYYRRYFKELRLLVPAALV